MARKILHDILNGATQFGALKVLGEQDGRYIPGNGHLRMLLCRCECGDERLYHLQNVKLGKSTSCGCKMPDKVSASKVRHGDGMAGRVAPEYRVWAHIIGRCENPNDAAWPNYGGRGIKMCERWRASYEHFLSDMGRRPSASHSIDRINVNAGYEPSNCRWATKHTQDRNRRTNRMLTAAGRTQCLKDWARELGMHKSTIERRLKRGLSDEAALTKPA